MTEMPGKMGRPADRAPARGEGPLRARMAARRGQGGGDETPKPGAEIVERRHRDWKENHIRWHWLMDSYEGGQRYRNATYGPDRRGMPIRNLIRHRREYPDVMEYSDTFQGIGAFIAPASGLAERAGYGPYPGGSGADPSATAQDDQYEYRRSRTPVREFLREVVSHQIGKIYEQRVHRSGPEELVRFWQNVNGAGLPMGDWMRESVAPLVRVLGCLDVCFDRPRVPNGVEIRSKRDEIDWGLDTVVASCILPENMVWWRNDNAGNYVECLVREYDTEARADPDPASADGMADEAVRYRHWTESDVTLYDDEGEIVEGPDRHGYPFVPIRRIFGGERKHRTPMVGKPEHEEIAELQREYYNRESELILSDTLQASPLLSGPDDYCKPDGTLSVGISFVLPMKKDESRGTYQGWEYVTPSKAPAADIRENMRGLEDRKDGIAGLTKPAGVTGTTGGTVSQSGYSKMFDAERGCEILGANARCLSRGERELSEYALMCIRRLPIRPADRQAIRIVYPSRFQLRTAESILDMLSKIVPVLAMDQQMEAGPAAAEPSQSGGNPAGGRATPVAPATLYACPTIIAELLMQFAAANFVGAPDEFMARVRSEVLAFHKLHVLDEIGSEDDSEDMAGPGSEEQGAGVSRSGVSGATSVSGMTPVVV